MGKVSLKLADEYEDEELLLEKLNNDDDQLNQKSMHKEEIVERAQWTNELEYIMATIGFAIGLGNVWRFPYLVFKHGGAAFLIPFFILLFLVGIPVFLLETALGQFSALSPTDCFAKLCPLLEGVGYAAAIINLLVGLYYNVIIAYCLYYLTVSFRVELPWKNCHNEPNCFVRENLSEDCRTIRKNLLLKNITQTNSPSEIFFYDTVLEITDGIGNLGGLNPTITLCLILAWSCVFFALLKGVKTLGKTAYITAIFPYIMLTILVVKGFLLEGSEKGIQFYIGQFDIIRMLDSRLWMDACVQIFYAISSCCGGLISMSSFNNFNNNLMRDAFLIPILDIFTGFYAGIAIFTLLGHMYLFKCVNSFAEVAAQGPELAFIVYPEGLSLMGKLGPIFSVFFFLMMLFLGFGSEFSMMESSMSTILDHCKKRITTPKQVMIVRFLLCCSFCAIGCLMTTRGGFFILNLVDNYVAGYPVLIVGLLEVILIGWIYGTDRFCRDIECMVGKRSNIYWAAWKISWKYICPFVLIIVIVLSFFTNNDELNIRGMFYPTWAKVIGNILSIVPLCAIPFCAVKQAIKHDFNLKVLLNPVDSYYNNYNKYLRSQT